MNIYVASIQICHGQDEYDTTQIGAAKSLLGVFKSICEFLINELHAYDESPREYIKQEGGDIGDDEDYTTFFVRNSKLNSVSEAEASATSIYDKYGKSHKSFEISISTMEVRD